LTTALSASTLRLSASARAHLLILACAVSAGAHAVLAPAHFQEAPALGVGFGAAAVVLAALAVTLDRRPQSRPALNGAALVLGGLIVAYAASRTVGLPLLGEHREPLDAVGVGTKLIEAFALALAVTPSNRLAAGNSAAEKGVVS
jgi:hypothetical protein